MTKQDRLWQAMTGLERINTQTRYKFLDEVLKDNHPVNEESKLIHERLRGEHETLYSMFGRNLLREDVVIDENNVSNKWRVW